MTIEVFFFTLWRIHTNKQERSYFSLNLEAHAAWHSLMEPWCSWYSLKWGWGTNTETTHQKQNPFENVSLQGNRQCKTSITAHNCTSNSSALKSKSWKNRAKAAYVVGVGLFGCRGWSINTWPPLVQRCLGLHSSHPLNLLRAQWRAGGASEILRAHHTKKIVPQGDGTSFCLSHQFGNHILKHTWTEGTWSLLS